MLKSVFLSSDIIFASSCATKYVLTSVCKFLFKCISLLIFIFLFSSIELIFEVYILLHSITPSDIKLFSTSISLTFNLSSINSDGILFNIKLLYLF